MFTAKVPQLRKRRQIEAAGLTDGHHGNAAVRGRGKEQIARSGSLANECDKREVDPIPAILREIQDYPGRCGNELRLD